MTAQVKYDEVEVGTEIPAQTYHVSRLNLVMYAGASGDFNQIHWNETFAKSVLLPDVIEFLVDNRVGVTISIELSDWPARMIDYVRRRGIGVNWAGIGNNLEPVWLNASLSLVAPGSLDRTSRLHSNEIDQLPRL